MTSLTGEERHDKGIEKAVRQLYGERNLANEYRHVSTDGYERFHFHVFYERGELDCIREREYIGREDRLITDIFEYKTNGKKGKAEQQLNRAWSRFDHTVNCHYVTHESGAMQNPRVETVFAATDQPCYSVSDCEDFRK